jgi:hypothetical protein
LESCLKFINDNNTNQYGSSKNWPDDYLPLNGFTSPARGGEFAMWTKVVIKSCDGGAFMGNRAPIDVKGHKLYFRGRLIIDAVFAYLRTSKLITNKNEIVISGSLNGAVAAMNYI